MQLKFKRYLKSNGAYFVIVLASIIILFPIMWIIATSLKTQMDTFKIPIKFFSDNPTISSYIKMWAHRPYLRYIFNSLIVAGTSTLISLIVASLAAYGFSRYKFRSSNLLLILILEAQMVPIIVLVIPYFKIMTFLNLFDTIGGLIISYIAFILPFTIWILKGYFDSIPIELDEAAAIDGCSPFKTFWLIIFPVAVPGIIAAGIFAFVLAWNEFTLAYILINSNINLTIGVGIAYLFGEYSTSWNELMAAGMVASIVPAILFFTASKYLVSGLTSGAMKN